MKVAVIPDAAMIIIPLIEKNGHEYISPTNFSKYNNNENEDPDDKLDRSRAPFTLYGERILIGNKYTTNEVPSGVRGRLSLMDIIIQDAEAAIILGHRPKDYKPMYDVLNELILFGGTGCINEHRLVINIMKNKNIPILEIAHPNNQEEIIKLINRVNDFLRNLDKYKGKKIIFNDDDLTIDLNERENEKIDLNEFNRILNEY